MTSFSVVRLRVLQQCSHSQPTNTGALGFQVASRRTKSLFIQYLQPEPKGILGEPRPHTSRLAVSSVHMLSPAMLV
ncbi:hypothetical protein VTO73DRAFT_2730 [Trametes versicolor]